MSMPGLRFSHVAFRVADIERSLAWYKAVFGAELVCHVPAVGPKPEYFYAEFRPGQMVEFFTGGTGAPERVASSSGFEHFSLIVDDIHAAIAHLEATGANITRPYFEGRAGQKVVFVADPDGNTIELMELVPESPIYRA